MEARVEDALHATRAAVEEGIVEHPKDEEANAGGGHAGHGHGDL